MCIPETGLFKPFARDGYNYHGPEEGIQAFLQAMNAPPSDG
jgi:hypothetical protein